MPEMVRRRLDFDCGLSGRKLTDSSSARLIQIKPVEGRFRGILRNINKTKGRAILLAQGPILIDRGLCTLGKIAAGCRKAEDRQMTKRERETQVSGRRLRGGSHGPQSLARVFCERSASAQYCPLADT